MNNNLEDKEAFQNWMWGQMHPQDFLIRWGVIGYTNLGLLCGVSECTVKHWFEDKTASSYRPPAQRYQRLLSQMDWFLETFDLTPEELIQEYYRENK
ncbi:hypothetical protein VB834_15040 [Limnoraphis robusta Tam1]|uniref:hypothetical protein n=1 Tax=Limnoraphis robusta TaxID=1118279 RepID=UPI002B20FD46|nr:hypothetical protein [Limnoraphis robusta]MEA5498314.1 hypothetical protein [Limnoraphis robusta BA-68 BA1]MEA5540339.1 hypothetical protein [Limnoraphis robusta Tam1]